MVDSNAVAPSDEDIDNFDHYVGNYIVAVTTKLLDEGIPITSFDIETPGLREDDLVEGEAWLHLSREFRRRVSPVGEGGLDWNEISGWSFERDLTDKVTERRYLGHGLTPDPERVAMFATAMQVNPDSAGSLERPYYRRAGAPYDDLFTRLEHYVPKWAKPHQEAFTDARARHFERRIATALAADPPGPTVNLTLLPGEFTALEFMLEYVGGSFLYGGTEVIEAFSRDLCDRRNLAPASIAGIRTYLGAALARVEELRKSDVRAADDED